MKSHAAYDTVQTQHVNEGQGDLLVGGRNDIWPGTGFRTDRRAHAEIAATCRHAGGQPRAGRPPVLSPRHRARGARRHHHRLLPAGVHRRRRARSWQELFPDAIEVASADAYVLGLNAVSDGSTSCCPAAATGFAEQLCQAGFEPIGVDLSELLKGGGSVKCCTLEVHP